MTTSSVSSDISADDYAQKLFASALGAFEILGAHAGERLGWYRSLATCFGGGASRADLDAGALLPGMAGDAGQFRDPDRRCRYHCR